MTQLETVPDPDRDEPAVSSSDVPTTFHLNDSAEEESDDTETLTTYGYEPIGQDDEAEEDDDEADQELSMEEQVAALVRAAQSDESNLSSETRDILEKANEEKRQEEAKERVEIWQEMPAREDSINLDEAKMETIKSLMSGIKLASIPIWASDGSDDAWRDKLKH